MAQRWHGTALAWHSVGMAQHSTALACIVSIQGFSSSFWHDWRFRIMALDSRSQQRRLLTFFLTVAFYIAVFSLRGLVGDA